MTENLTDDDDGMYELKLSGPLRLACAEVACWKCGHGTSVVALCASLVEGVEGGVSVEDSGGPSFVSDVGEHDMPPDLVELLAAHAPQYKPTYSRTLQDTTWANVCGHCEALQGAFFMHGEPDGPFFAGPSEFEGEWKGLSEAGAVLGGGSYSL